MIDGPPARKQSQRKLNADEKRQQKAAEIQLFARQYARPAQKGIEPNDRRYQRRIERAIKNMRPNEFDELLNGET